MSIVARLLSIAESVEQRRVAHIGYRSDWTGLAARYGEPDHASDLGVWVALLDRFAAHDSSENDASGELVGRSGECDAVDLGNRFVHITTDSEDVGDELIASSNLLHGPSDVASGGADVVAPMNGAEKSREVFADGVHGLSLVGLRVRAEPGHGLSHARVKSLARRVLSDAGINGRSTRHGQSENGAIDVARHVLGGRDLVGDDDGPPAVAVERFPEFAHATATAPTPCVFQGAPWR